MVNFIEFPIFDGVSGDLRQWILWLEDFFVRENFTADEKMNMAQSLLEGKANAWFYSSRKRFIFQSWEHLIDHMIWRFGDFSDKELLLLFDKNDRLLQKQIDEAKLRRMSRTAITPHESISLPATIHEPVPVNKFSNQQVDEISGEKKDESHEAPLAKVSDSLEEELIHQNQVPVSQLEPSLQIPKASPNVCENSQAVVCCEHQRSIQKNIRMDVVNGDVERIQRVMSITKNVSAHQVFDKMYQLKRLKPKNKRKLHLSLKTWMFKFKHTSKRSKSLDVKLFSVEGISWLPKDSKAIYRSCVDNEFKEVVAGCEKKLFDRFQTSPSFALDVVNKTNKPWETHTPCTSTHVASVNSLSFAVGTADNFELCVGHETGIMKLKLLLQSGFAGDRLTELDFPISEIPGSLVFPWNLILLEFFLFLHLEDKVCLSGASISWWGWMVFDRGKNNIISGDVITRVFLDLKKFLCEKVHGVSCLSLAAQFNSIEIIQAVLEKIIQRDQEASTKNIDKLQLNLKQGLDVHGASGLRLFLRQQKFSSIWHRWRRKDCTRTSSIDQHHQGLFVLFLVRLVLLSTRYNPLFLHFWRKHCWCQWLLLPTGLMIWGAGSSCLRGSIVIYQRPLGCFYHCNFPSSSLRTSSFSGREVLIRFIIVFSAGVDSLGCDDVASVEE